MQLADLLAQRGDIEGLRASADADDEYAAGTATGESFDRAYAYIRENY